MVNTVFSRASWRMCRCASASAAVCTSRVGPVASVRRMSACTTEGPTAEMKSFLMPTAGSPRSWKPQEARKNAIPAKARGMTLDNDIHQTPGHDDNFLRLLPRRELHHRLVGHRGRGDLIAARGGGNVQVSTQLAVHLDHELDRVLHQRPGIDRGPRLVDQLRA